VACAQNDGGGGVGVVGVLALGYCCCWWCWCPLLVHSVILSLAEESSLAVAVGSLLCLCLWILRLRAPLVVCAQNDGGGGVLRVVGGAGVPFINCYLIYLLD
jgi:hypothetical protein